MTHMPTVLQYRTIWISDIHLGTRGCKSEFLLDFLRHTESEHLYLGSGLIDHSQKITAAAMAMADMNVWAQRSYRVWMRRQSLSFPNMFSILWRRR